MQKFMTFFILSILTFQINASELLHRSLMSHEKESNEFIWEQAEIKPFDELIISWDAARPQNGAFLIQVSIRELNSDWSPWLDYAFWGSSDQYTFKQVIPEHNIKVFQDTIEMLNGKQASAYKIRISAIEGASLNNFRTLHASTTDLKNHKIDSNVEESIYIELCLPGISQFALVDINSSRICSPTSTTAVIRYLLSNLPQFNLPQSHLSPLEFADQVCDTAFGIYGNWILNTAQASHYLGEPWHCCVTRLSNFHQILDQLKNGYPVVVSVRGPLPGSALPYALGHILVITGYNGCERTVICMDPAFPNDEKTIVKYTLDDFLIAWGRKKGLAYLFYQGGAGRLEIF